jgi:uncharacterized protein YbcC (UPF0753/DUF2309 family)
MSTEPAIRDCIERASETVGSVWPLHSFVTANPLAGYEDQPFHEAVQQATQHLGGEGYPDASVFEQAWERGAIDDQRLRSLLADHGYDADPEATLDRMAASEASEDDGGAPTTPVDDVLTKWLEAFLDQGQAQWAMPDREEGFYAAFRAVAPHDSEVPNGGTLTDLPESPTEAIKTVLSDVPPGDWQDVFEAHLTALPGWTGLIKQRATDDGAWQAAAPITLTDYLAVRLVLTEQFDAPLAPETPAEGDTDGDGPPLAELWLQAWEESYRGELVDALTDRSGAVSDDDTRPDAQLVFCIDTRSEIIRRHIESAGDYETHGYAGFFGVPMRHQGYDEDVTVDACPPILDAQHRIDDEPAHDCDVTADTHDHRAGLLDAGKHLVSALRKNAATAFSYVESAGSGYGLALAARTLAPGFVADATDSVDDAVPDAHEFCEPTLDSEGDGPLPQGLTHDEQVEYAATAFELMGIERFGRLVVFTGHASETANNPFDSSLDCGACAGNPGGPNARVLATICNDEDVKASLRERGIDVPDDTHFLAAEHNTTTDDITLFDSSVPESHHDDIEALRADLASAQEGATAERAEMMGADADDPVAETERRAADWAETRPEWGLAGNASFVVGPRELTANLDLDGRAFLHSYDHRTDPDGDALEAILTGPMVVTQWINNQYYFATVDTSVYGSGSKITQSPVGNVGVVQGNGGDLMTGLPLQSLTNGADDPYHQPLRLSTVVHAPRDQVEGILAANEHLATLLDNGWLSLTVVDPQRDAAFEYAGDLTWEPVAERPSVAEQPDAMAADD